MTRWSPSSFDVAKINIPWLWPWPWPCHDWTVTAGPVKGKIRTSPSYTQALTAGQVQSTFGPALSKFRCGPGAFSFRTWSRSRSRSRYIYWSPGPEKKKNHGGVPLYRHSLNWVILHDDCFARRRHDVHRRFFVLLRFAILQILGFSPTVVASQVV